MSSPGAGAGASQAGPPATGHGFELPPRVVRFQDVHEKAAAYMEPRDLRRLQRAYVFCARAHEGQSRLSGEPYLVHPIAVADILAEWRADAASVVAGLLHDVLEDTAATPEELGRLFGAEVAHLVDGVTKLSKLAFSTREEAQAESFRKMILAMADDLRVILVKLADRLHNMRTLGYLPADKRVAIAQETREIFAPIAHRMGIGSLKAELDDLSFRHLEPDRYAALLAELEQRQHVDESFIRQVEDRLRDVLREAGITGRIQGRRKSLTSINKKLIARGIGAEELHDYIAFRILLPSVHDCYAALGVIHSTWSHIQQRFKDYVAMPKPNGYQSLHTTLLSEKGATFEVQIRTQDMHLVAEKGVAAHWGYKEGRTLSPTEAERFAWLRNLLDAMKDHADPREFMAAVKMDLYGDEVYCFTPKGDVKVLPAGSTPIDFAFAIHSEVGLRCVGARIDGAIVPLRARLQHGNRVEILTAPTGRPSRDWLQHVATSRARSKIRQWFNAHEREVAVEVGRSVLDRELRRHGTTARKLLQTKAARHALRQMSFREPDDLLMALAHERVPVAVVISKLLPPESVAAARAGAERAAAASPSRVHVPGPRIPPSRARVPSALPRRTRRQGGSGPVVAAEGGLLTYMARCCNPIRGENITGYVTRGRGVSVHRSGCHNAAALAKDAGRVLPVAWDPDWDATFEVRLRLEVSDRPGVLGDVTGVIASMQTNIRNAEARSLPSRRGLIQVAVDVTDVAHLARVQQALQRIDGVRSVGRA
jgi:GTP pyrophosphokinase